MTSQFRNEICCDRHAIEKGTYALGGGSGTNGTEGEKRKGGEAIRNHCEYSWWIERGVEASLLRSGLS